MPLGRSLRGGDLPCVAHQVAALALMAILMNGWAVWSYRKNS